MTTAKKKPGPPMRFPERIVAHVTVETKQQLQALARQRQLTVPDVIRELLRVGLQDQA